MTVEVGWQRLTGRLADFSPAPFSLSLSLSVCVCVCASCALPPSEEKVQTMSINIMAMETAVSAVIAPGMVTCHGLGLGLWLGLGLELGLELGLGLAVTCHSVLARLLRHPCWSEEGTRHKPRPRCSTPGTTRRSRW